MHLGPFGSDMKLGAKCADLVKKFVPQSRIGIFRNEGTRSTPMDPKLMFWCVSYYLGHLGQFGRVTKLGAKRAELVQKFVPRSRVRIFATKAPDPHHWTITDVFLRFVLFDTKSR